MGSPASPFLYRSQFLFKFRFWATILASILTTKLLFCCGRTNGESSAIGAPDDGASNMWMHASKVASVVDGRGTVQQRHRVRGRSRNGREAATAPLAGQHVVMQENDGRSSDALMATAGLVLPPVPPKYDKGIPRILHRSWKTARVPAVMQKWTKTCTDLHPNWTHILWTDEMNRELIKQHYPFFLETYDSFELNIMRADAARVFYMHRYGGVYMDLDFECLKPLDPLLENNAALLGYLSDDYEYEHNIPNAWMASFPNHNFWEFAARFMSFNLYDPEVKETSAETMTGPVMIYTAYHKWMARYRDTADDAYKVVILDSVLIYPFDWHTRAPHEEYCWARAAKYNPGQCKRLLDVGGKQTFVITYWSHTWEKLK